MGCCRLSSSAWLFSQEPSTCQYVLTVAVPGLCQLPIFRAQAELVTQVVCHLLAAPAAEGLRRDPESQQRDAHFPDGELVKDDDSSTNSSNLESP